MEITQFVMAYGVEQDRIRALLPHGYESLRPALRVNVEIRNNNNLYIEYNAPVLSGAFRGWLNIGSWKSNDDDIRLRMEENTYVFQAPFLTIRFKPTGIKGGCPAEKDNDGCIFIRGKHIDVIAPTPIEANKEFCDCSFHWHFSDNDAHGESIGKTLPAIPSPIQHIYPCQEFTPQNAAAIPCKQVLGAYMVRLTTEK